VAGNTVRCEFRSEEACCELLYSVYLLYFLHVAKVVYGYSSSQS